MNLWVGIGLLIFWILVGVIGVTAAIRNESKIFNGGKCTNCNGVLRLFDCDSQGGRGYTCDTCKRKVWISYKKIDGDYLKGEKV